MLGCCLVSFNFRCDIHPIRPVLQDENNLRFQLGPCIQSHCCKYHHDFIFIRPRQSIQIIMRMHLTLKGEGLIVVMVHCATYPGSAFRQIASSDIYDDQCTTCYGHKDRIILCSYRERSVHGVGMSTFSIIGYLSLLSGTQRAMDLLVPLQIFPPFSSLKQCKCQKYK